MRRKVYPITIALCVLIGIGLYGFAVIDHDKGWAILGTGAIIIAALVRLDGNMQRLLSDWPPGIIWRHGWDSRDRARRTYRKRRNLDVVRPDDETGR